MARPPGTTSPPTPRPTLGDQPAGRWELLLGRRLHPALQHHAGEQQDVTNLLSRDCSYNPDFCTASHAYVRYCSADGHRVQQTASPFWPAGGGAPFRFTGHLNYIAIVWDLVAAHGLGAAGQQVLLTSCSAGGAGTFTNADSITSMLPAAKVVKAAPVSGWFWPGLAEDLSPAEQGWCSPSKFPDFQKGRTNCTLIESNYRGLVDLTLASRQPGCVAALGAADAWKCFTMHTSAQYIKTPLLVVENRFDSIQINGDGELPASQRGTAAGKAYLAYYSRAMNARRTPPCSSSCGGRAARSSCRRALTTAPTWVCPPRSGSAVSCCSRPWAAGSSGGTPCLCVWPTAAATCLATQRTTFESHESKGTAYSCESLFLKCRTVRGDAGEGWADQVTAAVGY